MGSFSLPVIFIGEKLIKDELFIKSIFVPLSIKILKSFGKTIVSFINHEPFLNLIVFCFYLLLKNLIF